MNKYLYCKRILQFLIYFLGIFILCLVFKYINSDNSIINIIEVCIFIIYILVASIILIFLIFKDNKNKIKQDIEAHNKVKKLDDFMEILDNFDYEAADDNQKTDYLLASLLETAFKKNLLHFYARTSEFRQKEIENLLTNTIDDEFNQVINEYIMKKIDYKYIAYFETRIHDVIFTRLGFHEDTSEYYYDKSHTSRFSILEDEKCIVIYEHFDYIHFKWHEKRKLTFKTIDDAYLSIRNFLNNINYIIDENKVFVCSEDYSEEELDRVTYFFELEKISETNNKELAIFTIYYFLKYQDFKSYKDYLKKKKRYSIDKKYLSEFGFYNKYRSSLKMFKNKEEVLSNEELKNELNNYIKNTPRKI